MIYLCIYNICCLGFMKAQLTMENGRRWSSDKILDKKPNHALVILTHAHATKVCWNNFYMQLQDVILLTNYINYIIEDISKLG